MYLALGKRQTAIDVLRKALEDYDVPYLRNMLRQLELGGGANPASGGLRK
jgi:hypothetical protein